MACLLVAAWTWVIAGVSLGDRPGWALVFAAIGGFAVGAQLMIAVYEDQRARGHRRNEGFHAGPLKLMRAASGGWEPLTYAGFPQQPRRIRRTRFKLEAE